MLDPATTNEAAWEPPRHRWSEVNVRNITFNPTFDTLPNACREAEDHGFALVRVVPVHQYQAVAVFERLGGGDDA